MTPTPSIDPFASATVMLRALRDREISAGELLELHLERIERYNAALNAVVIRDDERAREAARAADDALERGEGGPLLGLPFTAKDCIEVAGMRSTGGDPALARDEYVAEEDARVVARLRGAGGIVMAKTNMPPYNAEFQTVNPVYGRTNNPWALARTPGGSTGGGAAAVAAGLSPLEWGTDLTGSVRIPPAFCGIYGHKPSETALPRTGMTPSPGRDHLPNPTDRLSVFGVLARSAEDLELALEIASGPDVGEDAAWRLDLPPARHDHLADYRVAVLPDIAWLPVDGAIAMALERLATKLGRLGCDVAEIGPDHMGDWTDYLSLYRQLTIPPTTLEMPREERARIAERLRGQAALSDDPFIEPAAQALDASAQDWITWYRQREAYRAAFRAFFQDWDVLLTPVTFVNAFRHDEAPVEIPGDQRAFNVHGEAVPYGYLGTYAAIATLCGQPATVFPAGQSETGLPVGLQAMGPYLEDRTPIRFAALVGQAFGGYEPPPGYEEA